MKKPSERVTPTADGETTVTKSDCDSSDCPEGGEQCQKVIHFAGGGEECQKTTYNVSATSSTERRLATAMRHTPGHHSYHESYAGPLKIFFGRFWAIQ